MNVTDRFVNFGERDGYLDVNTVDRNALFLISHFGFVVFNVINVGVLVLLEGYAARRFWTNHVAQISLAAHLMQLVSCVTSLHRFNTNDEFGYWGGAGVVTGVAGVFIMNIVYLHLLFFNNTKKIKWGIVFWAAVSVLVLLLSYRYWSTENFKYFRIFLAVSIISYNIPMWMARKALMNGAFTLEENFLSVDVMVRVWDVLMALDSLWVVAVATSLPILIYPITGMVYTLCMINAVCMGRMSFMQGDGGIVKDHSSGATSCERLPLNNTNKQEMHV